MMDERFYQAEFETAGREELEKIQTERLIKAVKTNYENVPFYKQLMDEHGVKPEDIKSIKDISKLPFTYKNDLRDNYPFGMLAVPMSEVTRIHASSGTTGKQTVVGYTANDVDIWSISVARALVAASATKEDIVHVSYGYGLFTGGLGLHYGAEKLGAVAVPVSTGNTQRQIQILQDYGSDIICCTPSYAAHIGETCQQIGVDTSKLKVRAGIFGAECWGEGMRKHIEETLNIEAFDIYGLSEIAGPGVSFECKHHCGLHINEDFFYPEIIDPETGEVLPDGEEGELVFTCIGKEALPLLRYRTRDLCSLDHAKCECGRTLVRMSRPKGRSDDMLIIRGVNVFPSQVEYVLTKLNITPNYLIVVDRINNLDVMEVQVEMDGEMFSDSVKDIEKYAKKIETELLSTLNISAKVKLVEPNTLVRSEGKSKRVIDKRQY